MQIGMIGLGRMGGSMVRRLLTGGHGRVVPDTQASSVAALVRDGAIGVGSLPQMVSLLPKPRAIRVMVPAAVVDQALGDLVSLLNIDDIVVDGGNSYFRDDVRRSSELRPHGIRHLDVASGGVAGLARGFCLIIGGDADTFEYLRPIFASLAPGIAAAASLTPVRSNSISMGEDGPTHQRVEQQASFRAMPGMVLSRQALPTLDRSKYASASASGVALGVYVLADAAGGRPDVPLVATGSEVALCIGAYEQLTSEGVRARVISMPSWKLFESQSAEYRDSVLPPAVTARVSVEAASSLGRERHVGQRGTIIGMRSFGISAPGKVAEAHFGFDVARVVAAAREQFARQKRAA